MAELGGQGVPPSETANTDQAEQLLEDAENAGVPTAAEGLYRQALTAAEAEVAANPDNPLGHRLAALASLGLGEYQQAGAHFDRAAELYPLYEFEDMQLREQTWIELYNEAMPLLSQNDYEGAVVLLDDANAIFTSRPEGFITAAQLYGQLQQAEPALEALDRAEEIIAGVSEDEYDAETVADWRSQGETLPVLRAQILSNAGRYEEASQVFAQILAEDPGNVDVAMNLAATQMQTGDEAAALETYDRLLNDPSLGAADFYRIGIGFYQGAVYEQAAEAFGRAVGENPTDRDGLEMWARSLQIDSAYAEVPAVAERWLELDPNSRNGLLIFAQAVNQTGDGQRAGEIVQQIDEMDVSVDELQMQRYGSGGARVTGTVNNQNLSEGTAVTLTFTFYDFNGTPLGTVEHALQVGSPEVSDLFEVEFESSEQVGGYGYDLTIG
jgi:tetratricopeptide (TPR) repeat protein